MKHLNVEFIEQPLPVEAACEMVAVARACELPVIADESCELEADVPKCKQAGFHGIWWAA